LFDGQRPVCLAAPGMRLRNCSRYKSMRADISREIGKSSARRVLVSAAGMSSAHRSPVLMRCWPIRRAVSVRLRKGMSARRAMTKPSRY
jgi:hypothetical protein